MLDKAKILVIDDDEVIRDSCKQIISEQDHQVELAYNGEVGLQKMNEIKPDLVLIDLKMPGIDGMTLIDTIHQLDSNIIMIVITGYATIESAVEAIKLGAYDFLPKPFTPNELRIVTKRGLERRKLILETEILRKEKEKLRENFITLVSHELRSPLSAVQQNLMVITTGMSGVIPEKIKNILQKMSKRINDLIALINDWLNMSRIETGEIIREMHPVNLKEILSDVIDQVNPLAKEKKVTLQLHYPEKYPEIMGNRETLQMLFTNLIDNGIKYNNDNGRVDITVEGETDHTKVTIRDHGIGIQKEKLPLIFEQFYRVKQDAFTQGSGLGLSIAKQIAEAHYGSIEVQSEVNVGTTFTVYLP